ncbi:MinD/ParA family ATP-binding protein [Noviherbaspirillum denitrificans]|uniref:Antiactivator of flagellar biosynthesis FleN protein n=1 Tax=Noviherbaspirillum denitrificans TaxID=1968433 RepID=A0A254TFF8_9BURK|nr:antiactivator of flagellar biosynthesis FleN protein [Noviherbaspirillum denitrificans]OWW21389.1 antiactivator of flagellar biosynthesis FleN protein [Noviherbaspirillum denitrificans]
MASFDFDQAEGLRRMLAGPKPRVFTFLSAATGEEKGAMLVNLGASLAQAGRDVLLVDASLQSEGIASRLNGLRGATLTQVARQERRLEEAILPMPQGFGVVALKRGPQRTAVKDVELASRLDDAFEQISTRADIVVVDAELDREDSLAIPALNETEIVVQVANNPDSIKSAYTLIKRLNHKLGRRPFSILVTGATDAEAQVVFENMAKAANRYLAVKLNSMGSVPADEHLKRAMHLGRAVVDAFPLAGASVAFRRLAGRVVLSDMAAAG